MKQQIIFLSLCAFFYGCSKPESAVTPVAEAPAEPAIQTARLRPVIATFGDSLTAGFGVEDNESYPFYLQKLLDEQGYQYRVANHGLSGDTTAGGVDRVAQVLADHPEVVVLELGGNDGLRGLPVKASVANFEKIVTELQAGGTKIVLAGITLPRNYGADYIRDFEAMYKNLSTKYTLPMIPFLLEGVAMVPGMMQADGIHATSAGNRKVAATVLAKLKPLIAK